MRHELVYLTLNVPEGDVLLAWAADAHRRQAAAVVFTNAAGGAALETLLLPAAYCVSYAEAFVAGDAQNGAYVCHLVLSELSSCLIPRRLWTTTCATWSSPNPMGLPSERAGWGG